MMIHPILEDSLLDPLELVISEVNRAVPAFTLRPRSRTKPVKLIDFMVTAGLPSICQCQTYHTSDLLASSSWKEEGDGGSRASSKSLQPRGTDPPSRKRPTRPAPPINPKSSCSAMWHVKTLRLNGNKRPNIGQTQAKQASKFTVMKHSKSPSQPNHSTHKMG